MHPATRAAGLGFAWDDQPAERRRSTSASADSVAFMAGLATLVHSLGLLVDDLEFDQSEADATLDSRPGVGLDEVIEAERQSTTKFQDR